MTQALGADLSSLQPDKLMTAATDETGLTDYGHDDLVDALTRYLDLVTSEARSSPMGVVAQCANVHRLLVNRLRLVQDLSRHTEILDEVVSDPIVIVGLPRTGTTKLQRIMSCDPGVQATLFWRLFYPAPLPYSGQDGVDPRIQVAQQFEAFITSYHPNLMALHPFRAEEPEEGRSARPPFGRSATVIDCACRHGGPGGSPIRSRTSTPFCDSAFNICSGKTVAGRAGHGFSSRRRIPGE